MPHLRHVSTDTRTYQEKYSKKNCEKPAILKDKLRFATETS
jgi:hypothetical protein